MPSVHGDDDDAISDCSDSSSSSSFEDEVEEGTSEIDAEFAVVTGLVLCDKMIRITTRASMLYEFGLRFCAGSLQKIVIRCCLGFLLFDVDPRWSCMHHAIRPLVIPV